MNLAGATVAVTGATGFLGRYVVETLLRRGAHVVGVVRNPDKVPGLARKGVELRPADLTERDRLTEGFRGADAVVSNAALFSLRNQSWDDHLRTNILGAENVFEAVAAAGVHRVAHVSSVAVYRGTSPSPIDEDHPQHSESSPRRPWTVYAISKAISEQLAWRLAGKRGLELTTVRPCAIYGAFDPNLMGVLRWITAWPLVPAPAFMRNPFVYAGDVAEGIALALEKTESAGKAYNLTGEDATAWEFLSAWKEAGGKIGSIWLPLPVPFRRAFDHGRARRDLGWRNRPFVEGFRETLALEAAAGRG